MTPNLLRGLSWVGLACLLVACASSPRAQSEPAAVAEAAGPAPTATVEAPATTAPVPAAKPERSQIPELLKDVVADAYQRPKDPSCAGLASEIAALNVVLGEDLDNPEALKKDDNVAADLMAGAVRGLIPYHSWLRRIAGVDRRERKVVAAIAAGGVRRAYLKGLGEAQDCPLSARPLRPPVPAE